MEILEIINTSISLCALGVSIYVVRKLNVVHHTFNSQMDKLIKMKEVVSYNVGLEEGRREQK